MRQEALVDHLTCFPQDAWHIWTRLFSAVEWLWFLPRSLMWICFLCSIAYLPFRGALELLFMPTSFAALDPKGYPFQLGLKGIQTTMFPIVFQGDMESPPFWRTHSVPPYWLEGSPKVGPGVALLLESKSLLKCHHRAVFGLAMKQVASNNKPGPGWGLLAAKDAISADQFGWPLGRVASRGTLLVFLCPLSK